MRLRLEGYKRGLPFTRRGDGREDVESGEKCKWRHSEVSRGELVDFMRLLKPGTKTQNITFQLLEESSYFMDIL